MRFHIGFSKRLSIKKIIEIIGFLFIALLTFFGIYENAHAEELIWNNLNNQSQYITLNDFEYFDVNDNFNLKKADDVYLEYNSGLLGYYIRDNTERAHKQFVFAETTNALNNATNQVYMYNTSRILDYASLKYEPNNNLCPNNTSDLKSINFKITIDSLISAENSSYFGVYNNNFMTFTNNIFGLRIKAHVLKANQDLYFSTTCSLDSILNGNNALYTCNNVFNGNINYYVDYYLIEYYNRIPFENIYFDDNDNYAYVSKYLSLKIPSNDNEQNSYPFQYSCSDESPVLNGSFPDVDPGNFGSIYDSIKDNYNVDLPGIDTSKMLLSLPSTFTDLLLLPFNLVQAVVNNSSTCSTYDIDFSSIVSKWGDPNSSYILHLPCMRDVLSNKLGNWYTIFDMLICFLVFYDITMHVINLINAITEGEDLFSYFFQKSGSNRVAYVDSSTGEVLNHG